MSAPSPKFENYFKKFRKNIVGINQQFESPYGERKIIYADWIASGRLYAPIEKAIVENFGPFVANTHTETSETGTRMTKAYHYAHQFIKDHVNAGPDDVIITYGVGMTTVVNKLQRILGLKLCGGLTHGSCLKEMDRPVIFITHMEHHSNHTSWFETNAEVVVVPPGSDNKFDLNQLENLLKKYKNRKFKIGSFTACSNVTGIIPPVHQMAKLMHQHKGICFVDFAASAPYVDINMHPADPLESFDAIFFSPHKFLGGPGSSGVLIFNSKLYNSKAPDNPGGGTVDWTNPWGEYKYVDDIEAREDGGTPGFLQAIRTALAIELKNNMGTKNILSREHELLEIAFEHMSQINGLHILADCCRDRLGVISFYLENIHYNLVVKLLSDKFGVQVRGGCACAGTYGHFLLEVSYEQSQQITDKINHGDLSEKPGWVRLSLHPTMSNDELYYILDAINKIAKYAKKWEKDYLYNPKTNEYHHKKYIPDYDIKDWFKF